MGSPIKIIDLASELIKLSGYEPNVDIDIKLLDQGLEKKNRGVSNSKENLDKTRHDKIFVLDNKNRIIEKYQKDISKVTRIRR